LNIVIGGGTGTGKTSMLGALSSFIPPHERVVVIEDSKEVQLQRLHVIYLEARPEVLLRRLKKRDRDFERGISPEYLVRLTEAFREYFHRYTEAPLLVVNCSDIDFVEHGGDLADLIKEIRGMRQGVQHYIPLGSR